MVCLDSAEENMIPAIALFADHALEEKWNGWARPIATAGAFSDFLARWRVIDPNGTWGEATVIDDTLQYEDAERDEPEVFLCVGTDAFGEALFDLTGWVWVVI
jgi:hypothetical protein